MARLCDVALVGFTCDIYVINRTAKGELRCKYGGQEGRFVGLLQVHVSSKLSDIRRAMRAAAAGVAWGCAARLSDVVLVCSTSDLSAIDRMARKDAGRGKETRGDLAFPCVERLLLPGFCPGRALGIWQSVEQRRSSCVG